jgi:ABC-type multidrug transport system fused ATPase/permease subunit
MAQVKGGLFKEWRQRQSDKLEKSTEEGKEKSRLRQQELKQKQQEQIQNMKKVREDYALERKEINEEYNRDKAESKAREEKAQEERAAKAAGTASPGYKPTLLLRILQAFTFLAVAVPVWATLTLPVTLGILALGGALGIDSSGFMGWVIGAFIVAIPIIIALLLGRLAVHITYLFALFGARLSTKNVESEMVSSEDSPRY